MTTVNIETHPLVLPAHFFCVDVLRDGTFGIFAVLPSSAIEIGISDDKLLRLRWPGLPIVGEFDLLVKQLHFHFFQNLEAGLREDEGGNPRLHKL